MKNKTTLIKQKLLNLNYYNLATMKNKTTLIKQETIDT